MQKIRLRACLALAILGIAISVNDDYNSVFYAKGQTTEKEPTSSGGQDSVSVLLDGKIIPSKSFIHMYDSTPSTISVGHVAAHLPCNSGGDTTLNVVAGIAPDLSPLNFTLADKLSVLGTVCMYHADIPQREGAAITDIALLNPTEQSITLPDTTSVVIHVSEFDTGPEDVGEKH